MKTDFSMRTEQGKQFLSLLIQQICTEHPQCHASCYFRAVNKTEGFPDAQTVKNPPATQETPNKTHKTSRGVGGAAVSKGGLSSKEPVLCLTVETSKTLPHPLIPAPKSTLTCLLLLHCSLNPCSPVAPASIQVWTQRPAQGHLSAPD